MLDKVPIQNETLPSISNLTEYTQYRRELFSKFENVLNVTLHTVYMSVCHSYIFVNLACDSDIQGFRSKCLQTVLVVSVPVKIESEICIVASTMRWQRGIDVL